MMTRVLSIDEVDRGCRQPLVVSSDPELLAGVAALLAERLARAPTATLIAPRAIRPVPDRRPAKTPPATGLKPENPQG
jgi:hypothetical protein